MIQKERGLTFESKNMEMWELIHDGRRYMFNNRISNVTQINQPSQFYGGIIADPMGLGKALAMVADPKFSIIRDTDTATRLHS
ncbi:uncharacterized protein GGS25DRAFT_383765 [Hypoxylon fragiforme]|uniref:uncharacterized protein n=1 Tax=Hypoxylon fragiforme TaxID=63214 RepID=UPI0020C72DD2|nr:uncharacterized protein GGS25DRAFT_383765 [Hypoxylon fragiforme]KAI2606301.1 hypothetical protein GGS25DRAFT_383765 [Hypoxylon fragiforme]